MLFSSLEESVYFITRSIPVFVALPITETFDSLNMWRVAVLILFLRWLFVGERVSGFLNSCALLFSKARQGFWGAWLYAWKEWRVETLALLLFLVSVLSLVNAENPTLGIKRIIYFANLWMLFFVVRQTANRENAVKIAWNAVIGGSVVIAVGALQLISAYTMGVDNFSEFWALGVNKTLYGAAWANIAINANTWFAYYNDTIHLRMFSSFPDTHSFPLYLLMVICFAMFLRKTFFVSLLVALACAEVVLSGTRGIWASVLFPLLFLGYLFVKKFQLPSAVFSPFILFFLLLLLSSFIFNSTQFKLTGTGAERAVLAERIKSILDTGETSNQGRIFIWKKTIGSIQNNPLLGVGVGNFPVILKLNPTASKAGASAHNLYLNFFAELGVFGFALFMCIVYEIWKAGWRLFMRREDVLMSFFGLNFLLYFLWILWYSMTDVAVFDERAFLLFMILLGVIFALPSRYGTTARIN
ncbi:O-antigen ligase family protein [Candidatus Azambacteria bacterium]|nr:O-antigen ligase family protein [Candidatus Azambacteria bacterium]